ncbi:MAG: LuxR C-terminal-related transcriptional regulator [Candidatus Aquicultor sp.]
MGGRQQFGLLLKTVLETNSSFDLDEVLTHASIRISEAIGLPYCGIYLIDEKKNALVLRGRAGRITDTSLLRTMAMGSIALDEPLAQKALCSEKPVMVPDAENSPLIDEYHKARLPLKSLLAIPLRARRKPLGLAMIPSFDRQVTFSNDRIEIANDIAKAAALAIDNAQLFQETYPHRVQEAKNSTSQDELDKVIQPSARTLSQRELDVLRLLGLGLKNKEIAAELYITERTVKAHVSSILDKLGVADRTAAVIVAVRRGLFIP